MPRDYGILDKHEGSGLLPWSRTSERLATSRNYWVHTTRPDRRPHVKPVWGLWFDGHFYFGTSPKSIDGQNTAANASLVVNLESGDDVVIVEGTAEMVADSALLSLLDEGYFAKYSYHIAGSEAGPVYMLRHKVVFAWLESDFVGSATKYEFQV
jgi:hypothetical protein